MRWFRTAVRTIREIAEVIACALDLVGIWVIILMPVYGYRATVRSGGQVVQRTFRGGQILELSRFGAEYPDQELVEYRYWYVWNPSRFRVLFAEDDE